MIGTLGSEAGGAVAWRSTGTIVAVGTNPGGTDGAVVAIMLDESIAVVGWVVCCCCEISNTSLGVSVVVTMASNRGERWVQS